MTAEEQVINFKIEQKENEDFNLLENAFKKNCNRKCELIRSESGEHFDAMFYVADENGKMRLNSYIEIKSREFPDTKYKDVILSCDKVQYLEEIKDNVHIPIKVAFIYCQSNSYYIYDIEEIKSKPKTYLKVNKCTANNREEKVLSLVYNIPLDPIRKRNLHLND